MNEPLADSPSSIEAAGGEYLFIPPTLDSFGTFRNDRLAGFTERHRITLLQIGLTPFNRKKFDELLHTSKVRGVVLGFGLGPGYLSTAQLRLARSALRSDLRVFAYWPEEQAVEVIDAARYKSFRRIWLCAQLYRFLIGPLHRLPKTLGTFGRRVGQLGLFALTRPRQLVRGLFHVTKFILQHGTAELGSASPFEKIKWTVHEANQLAHSTAEVPFPRAEPPTPSRPVPGIGVYLRTDYWNRITSGGSYGHTCYVAKELSRTTERLICLMAQPYPLLDELGIEQVVMDAHSIWAEEEELIAANPHYTSVLAPFMHVARPSYIYERHILGNYVGAKMSHRFGIPYFLEYNGSEISMRKSFDGQGYEYEKFYLCAEDAAFRQATVISVVSEPIKEDLVGRGIPEGKILVNPNCVDIPQYTRPDETERRRIREEIGLGAYDVVIGFTGTFGGWHGIEVLAEAIPRIVDELPNAALLLIGDGAYKHQVDQVVMKHRLQDRVLTPGRVPQQEGARLLGVCDLYVSPHSRHMVDSRFFGSPTKIFEYMAMGGGIVASDLEQIGEVLTPGLKATDLEREDLNVDQERAVLCVPGDVDDFVQAVVGLGRRPDLAAQLGHNARQAAIDEYSWERHVEKLWAFACSRSSSAGGKATTFNESSSGAHRGRISAAAGNGSSLPESTTDETFKLEAQNLWDNDPCGAHFVGSLPANTLDWYLEAERYRYDEYAPWMPEMMEFTDHAGERVLELGGGMGTDLAQFAAAGSRVTDYDLSLGHLDLASENFRLRGLSGGFVHGDGEHLPFPDSTYDVVYSNGVIHHIPDTRRVVDEIYRVLRPGGKAIVMVYAESSLQYWLELVVNQGLHLQHLKLYSMGEIMSRQVEVSAGDARPLVKVYTRDRLRRLFDRFEVEGISQRQMTEPVRPLLLKPVPRWFKERRAGWNLVIKAVKPE